MREERDCISILRLKMSRVKEVKGWIQGRRQHRRNAAEKQAKISEHTLGLLIEVAPDANRSKGCIWNASGPSCMVLNLRNLVGRVAKMELNGVNLIAKCLAAVNGTFDMPFYQKRKDDLDVDDEVQEVVEVRSK